MIIDFLQFQESKTAIIEFAPYVKKLVISKDVNKCSDYPSELLPIEFESPTIAELTRWNKSCWVILPDENYNNCQELHKIIEEKEAEILNPNIKNLTFQSTSLQTLRGIHKICLCAKGKCFLQFGPNSDTKLQTIVFYNMPEIQFSHIIIKGIPEVYLALNDAMISSKWENVDFNKVELVNLNGNYYGGDIKDISVLGDVNTLTVSYLNIVKFPYPSKAQGQKWSFHKVNICDVSNFGNLTALMLSSCDSVRDISALGKVNYLTIKDCKKILKYPKAEGKLQTWKLELLNLKEVDLMTATEGLHKLIIEGCFLHPTETNLRNIYSLEIISCHALVQLSLSDVEMVYLESSSIRKIHEICSVHNIHLLNCTNFTNICNLTNEAKLQQLIIDDCNKVSNLDWLQPVIGNMLRLVVQNCVSLSSIEAVLSACQSGRLDFDYNGTNMNFTPFVQSLSTVFTIKYAFTNFSLRYAVDMWCSNKMKAHAIYGDINQWDVSQVTDMNCLFLDQKHFNSEIGYWDTGNVTTMRSLFDFAESFNQPIDSWNTSKVRDLAGMFIKAFSFNQPLNSWDVSKVMEMSQMFYHASSFNQPLNLWDVSNATDMCHMFSKALSFNQPLNLWNVGKATTMRGMFRNAILFNQPLSNWDVSRVENMSEMFKDAKSFNQSLNTWNVNRVYDFRYMFHRASMFSYSPFAWETYQDILDLPLTSVEDMFKGTKVDEPKWYIAIVKDAQRTREEEEEN